MPRLRDLCASAFNLRADEPFFKNGDVIALVGGEDMVAMSEYGYLELLLTRALPGHRLKFRNLAWEGDTVFEQRRDLNFPPLEAQLEQVGATVIICQFGQMESLAGKEKLPEFIAAYEKLLARMSGGEKRRVVLVTPMMFEIEHGSPIIQSEILRERNAVRELYADAVKGMAHPPGMIFVNWLEVELRDVFTGGLGPFTRDSTHLNDRGHANAARGILERLSVAHPNRALAQPLGRLITAKNRLWFDYWRVQNWAFLAGDRTEQPSSRDHVDRTKRWFPAEREQFLPLIDAKEQEIWTLAAKLAQP